MNGTIYFMDRNDGNGTIRVGFDGTGKRISSHENNGYRLIAVMPGTKELEDRIHAELRGEAREYGKSHYAGPAIERYIEQLLADGYAVRERDALPHVPTAPIDVVKPSAISAAPRWAVDFGSGQLNLLRADPRQDTERSRRLDAAASFCKHTSKSDEWYTPLYLIEAAKRVLGTIDLDPASCPKANRRIGAVAYYSEACSGLDVRHAWRGRVWMNPPFNRRGPLFAARLRDEVVAGNVTEACALFSLGHMSALWFQETIYPISAAVGVTRARLQFDVGRDDQINGGAQPGQGHVIAYVGPTIDGFREAFRDHLTIYETRRPA